LLERRAVASQRISGFDLSVEVVSAGFCAKHPELKKALK